MVGIAATTPNGLMEVPGGNIAINIPLVGVAFARILQRKKFAETRRLLGTAGGSAAGVLAKVAGVLRR